MSLDGLTQRQILLGVLVLAVVASLTGVALAVLTGTAAHGGRGGAVAVALSFAALFAGRNTPEALLRDRTEDGRVAIEVEPCEQRIRRLHGAINVMIDSQRQEKRYAQFALAMLSGCPTCVRPATEANTARGVGSFGRTARWYQAR